MLKQLFQLLKFSSSENNAEQNNVMMKHQHKIPKLPIPDLDGSCSQFLTMVKPLLTESEYEETLKATEKFRNGIGIELQEALLKYDEDVVGKTSSYIEKWWDQAYLQPDSSIPIHVNPYFVLEDSPDPTCENQCFRAAGLVLSALKFVLAVRKGTLKPDCVRNTPLDMSQYRLLFNTARIPSAEKGLNRTDRIEHFDYKDKATLTSHIVVIIKNEFFYFDVLSDDGLSVSIAETELIWNLNNIKEQVNHPKKLTKNGIGALTSMSRSDWGTVRENMRKLDLKNAQAIDIIDQAIFILCLDHSSPQSTKECIATALRGYSKSETALPEEHTCFNRWFDKLQLIVCENGKAMVNFEHSPADGHTVLRFAGDMYADTLVEFARTISGRSTVRTNLKSFRMSTSRKTHAVHRLDFNLDEEAHKMIGKAKSDFKSLIDLYDLGGLEYLNYGKQFIISNNLSPDAFVQMAMLAAHYKVISLDRKENDGNTLSCTYESVMTKHFMKGRTEAGRTSSTAALEYFKAFYDETASPDHIHALLVAATQSHSKMTKTCAAGQGVDRHLYGLKSIWKEQKDSVPDRFGDVLPELFETSGYKKLSTSVVSTSNCGNPSLRFFGFGPVCEDGIGVGYIIKKDRVMFSFSSKKISTEEYVTALTDYLDRLQVLLQKKNEIESLSS